jgi:hypothetical protein
VLPNLWGEIVLSSGTVYVRRAFQYVVHPAARAACRMSHSAAPQLVGSFEEDAGGSLLAGCVAGSLLLLVITT